MLFRGFVIAGAAARFAVHQSVLTNANVELRLAQAAELIALALGFRHFALTAPILGLPGSGRHSSNVAPRRAPRNVPLVTGVILRNRQLAGQHSPYHNFSVFSVPYNST